MAALTTLIVFAKLPEPGRVKTRLARRIGDEAAAALAHAFLMDTWESLAPIESMRPVLAVTGRGSLPRLDPPPQVWEQGDGDLGERMERALARGLDRTPAAIVVGTDAPSRPPSMVTEAARALHAGRSAVLGPTQDGGYHLLGVRAAPAGLLAGLPWSSTETLKATERRFAEQGWDPLRLPLWYDVDEPEDLERLMLDLAGGTMHLGHTRATLELLSGSERKSRR